MALSVDIVCWLFCTKGKSTPIGLCTLTRFCWTNWKWSLSQWGVDIYIVNVYVLIALRCITNFVPYSNSLLGILVFKGDSLSRKYNNYHQYLLICQFKSVYYSCPLSLFPRQWLVRPDLIGSSKRIERRRYRNVRKQLVDFYNCCLWYEWMLILIQIMSIWHFPTRNQQ